MKNGKVFSDALVQFIARANEAAEARNTYRVRWSKSYMASAEKTDTGRKAAADVETSELRLMRDMREINAEAARHAMLFERGPEVITRPEEE